MRVVNSYLDGVGPTLLARKPAVEKSVFESSSYLLLF